MTKGQSPRPRYSLVYCLTILMTIWLAGFGPVAPAGASECRLVIAVPPEQNIFKESERWALLEPYLTSTMHCEVRFSVASQYHQLLDRLASGEADGAFLGSLAGIVALQQLDLLPTVRPVMENGTSSYRGLLACRADILDITNEKLASQKLALVEKMTTAGYLFPLIYFKRLGIDNMETAFAEIFYTGSHDAAIEALGSGVAGVAAFKDSVWASYQKKNPGKAAKLRILAASPEVPMNTLFMRPGIEAATTRKTSEAFLSLHERPAGRDLLAKMGYQRFIVTEAKQFASVQELAREADIDLKDLLAPTP